MNHRLGAVAGAVLIAAVLLWVARLSGYRLFVLLGGLVGILLLVGFFLLGAAVATHHH